jgi:hypothetical protein
MSHAIPIMRQPPLRTLNATVRLRGQDFTFKLYSRPLLLGNSATVTYYWMDSREFRNLGSDASLANFRNCVGHWINAVHASGLGDDLDQQAHFVAALCYPLVSSCKSLQEVYLDAHLAHHQQKAADPSSEAVRSRIQKIIASRDRFRIQEELDGVLGRFEPPAREMPMLQEAYRRWVGTGVVLMRAHGEDGLVQFLREADDWLSKYRKRSGQRVRNFINMFAYESKVCFYRCYANVWVDLIRWLRNHDGLDEVSERFLRFWHNQNQPFEIPHGRTIGGIYYATHAGATVIEENRYSPPESRSLIWETPHIGPTHVRDVFSGQVLSLHPLSAFFMQDQESCAKAGRFFTSSRYHDVMVRGRAEYCSEYWDLIGAILTAAHRYRHAHDEQAHHRRIRPSRSEQIKRISCEPEDYSEAAMLEDFAATMNVRCPICNNELQFDSHSPATERGGQGQANYRCRSCQRHVQIPLDQSVLKRFLLDPGE